MPHISWTRVLIVAFCLSVQMGCQSLRLRKQQDFSAVLQPASFPSQAPKPKNRIVSKAQDVAAGTAGVVMVIGAVCAVAVGWVYLNDDDEDDWD